MGTTVGTKRFVRKLRVAMTPLGRGVFAGRNFAIEEIIGKISGEIIDDPDYTSDYCMELTETTVLEPRGAYRYLNHSCAPNCELVIFEETRRARGVAAKTNSVAKKPPQLWLQTTRPIATGEELTIDYAWPADAAIPCRCSTSQCRGWVVDQSELAELRRRQKHVAPRHRRNTVKSSWVGQTV